MFETNIDVVNSAHQLTNEPPHDKTNKVACAPSEDSDQPGYPPSEDIRTAKTVISQADQAESSLGAQVILLVLS